MQTGLDRTVNLLSSGAPASNATIDKLLEAVYLLRSKLGLRATPRASNAFAGRRKRAAAGGDIVPMDPANVSLLFIFSTIQCMLVPYFLL